MYVIFLKNVLNVFKYYPKYNYDCLPCKYASLDIIPVVALLYIHSDRNNDGDLSLVHSKQGHSVDSKLCQQLMEATGTILWYAEELDIYYSHRCCQMEREHSQSLCICLAKLSNIM